MLIVVEAGPPGAPVNTVGNAVRTMPGGAATLRATVAVRTSDPERPCTGIVKLPIGVRLLAVSVSEENPEPETTGGTKVALTPAGSPPADNRTVPLKPPMEVILIGNWSGAADVICAAEGPEMAKSGA